MLISRLRVVFETVSNDIELWNKTASAQVDSQLRERRRNFKRRYESLDRIQTASNELDIRLQEVQAQDERVLQLQTRLGVLIDELVAQATSDPMDPEGALAAFEASTAAMPLDDASGVGADTVDIPLDDTARHLMTFRALPAGSAASESA